MKTYAAKKAGWMMTHSGRRFRPLRPCVRDIKLEDIAWGLSNRCRFSGQVEFYSVAEHSINMVVQARMDGVIDKAALRWMLLHDAAEAYLPDVPAPYKHKLIGFKEIETRLMRAIAKRFGLKWPAPPIVKEYDNRAVVTEGVTLLRDPLPRGWGPELPRGLGGISPLLIKKYPPDRVRHQFLAWADYFDFK